jgi:hypothetical protein
MNITDFQRRLNKSAGYDGVENMASAYGYYRSGISFYLLMQPAVLVADDGRNANLRARSLQPITSQKDAGTPAGGGGVVLKPIRPRKRDLENLGYVDWRILLAVERLGTCLEFVGFEE